MVLLWDMVENSLSPLQTSFSRFFVSGSSGKATLSWSEAPFERFCWHLHSPPRDMTPQLHSLSQALKRKPAARGERTLRVSSIVGWFSPPPELPFAADSVAPGDCPLVVVAARGLPATMREDAQNDSRPATTQGEPEAVRTAGSSPGRDEPAQLFHVGSSDSLAR